MMRGLFSLAWKHAVFHRFRTFLLVFSLSVGIAVPWALRWMTADLSQVLTQRARETPFLVGAPGSPRDLVISGLYFRPLSGPTIPFGWLEELGRDDLVQTVPLHLGHTAQEVPIVGTSLTYYSRHRLEVQSGTLPLRLGDCVLGAAVAERLHLTVGDKILSDGGSFVNPAGVMPLKMRITGILQRTHTVEDQAVFTDVKTCWLMDGIGHGHAAEEELSEEQILASDEDSVTAGANVIPFLEVTDANRDRFHFHGDQKAFPLSAVLIYPADERSAVLWEGRQQEVTSRLTVRPVEVVEELVTLLVNLRRVVEAVVVVLGGLMLLLLTLLMGVSLQLRETEMDTLQALGASRSIRGQLIGLDLLLIALLAIPLTILMTVLLVWWGQPLIFQWIL